MVLTEEFQISIHLTLKRLIEEKSKRDKVKFTACQLAQALAIPRSIITKLTHHDKTKRVTNPRIDTLMKIIDFFRKDGFDITVEDLLGIKTKTIHVKRQNLITQDQGVTIPVYSLDAKKGKLGMIDIRISGEYKDTIAFYTDKDIKPFFKAGSIFIVDSNSPLENDNLIAVKLVHDDHIQIKKYFIRNSKTILQSLDERGKDITLMPTIQLEIVGVVVQVNANT